MTTDGSATVTPLDIAFVGVGTMGAPMARQVLAGGHRVRVHDVDEAAIARLVDDGATAATSAAAAADGAALVLLSLPGPTHVADAVDGTGGVLAAAVLPAMIVDLSTNSVDAVRSLRARCSGVSVAFVDAPVSGGVAKARDGSLTVMVGAEPDEYASAVAVLRCIGEVVHVGPPGSGTIAKLVNNQLFLSAAVALQEAYLLGGALGMDIADLHAVVAASSAAPYTKLAPLLIGRRFDNVIFRLDIAAKDLAIAVESAGAHGVDIPLTQAARDVYDAAVVAGDGNLVFHATLRELERRAGFELPALRRSQRPTTAAAGTEQG